MRTTCTLAYVGLILEI